MLAFGYSAAEVLGPAPRCQDVLLGQPRPAIEQRLAEAARLIGIGSDAANANDTVDGVDVDRAQRQRGIAAELALDAVLKLRRVHIRGMVQERDNIDHSMRKPANRSGEMAGPAAPLEAPKP